MFQSFLISLFMYYCIVGIINSKYVLELFGDDIWFPDFAKFYTWLVTVLLFLTALAHNYLFLKEVFFK